MRKWSFDPESPIRDWLPIAVYPGYRPGLPDIWLGRLPEDIAAASGQNFKSWIIENPKETVLLEKALSEPMHLVDGWQLDFISGPDRAVRKKGHGPGMGRDFMIMSYSPPAEGWPWFLLTWSPIFDSDLERGCYAWETFDTAAQSDAHALEICRTIGIAPQVLTQVGVASQ
ncbi:hypothetical protein ACEUZ9_001081 [Paracoccus litorisediminis]|uniref:hypothetical protein n=1 Tax=Paracoccus litorisediminis TaxID=2006130 RepID=UPI00372DDEE8